MKNICGLAVFFIGILIGGQAMAKEHNNIYSIPVKTIDGKRKNLSKYRGKTLLIVNTASFCGYTPQYKGMEDLYQKYKDQGLEVLAFPANNFKNQEPGSNAEIKDFCFREYKTTFPLFAKISVAGGDIHPLYQYLTAESGFNGPISWNFNKFVISPEGKVIARFDSKITPLDPQLVSTVEQNLPVKK